MATCDTPGMVTITPNARFCRHKSMAVARGLAIVKPDEPFLVKLCNFGRDQVIVRKNSTLGFAEPYQGPMLAAVCGMEPLASSLLRSTPSSLLQTLCPYGLNPTEPGRSNGRSSLIRSTRY